MRRAEVGGSCEDDKQHSGPVESALVQSIELEMKEYESDGTSAEQSSEKHEQGNNNFQYWLKYDYPFMPNQFVS